MKKLIVLTSVLMVIVSCRPNKPPCNINVSTISGTYKQSAYTYKATPTSPEVDYFELLYPDACDRDNVYVIKPNGNYELKDVGEVCSPSNTDSGPWYLNGNTLNLDGLIFTIESFDCKKLVLSFSGLQIPGDKLNITLVKL